MHFIQLFSIPVVLSGMLCMAQTGTQASFTAPHKTNVPGGVLNSGSYTIRIVDHLTDRTVIQISALDGGKTFTFLATGDFGIGPDLSSGPSFWSKGLHGEDTLRGFRFAAGQELDFVYPKSDAVALANLNKTAVVAVDPVSERRPELSKLTPSDLQLVTLWSLTPVRVGPDLQKGMIARRYVASVNASDIAVRNPPTAAPSINVPRSTSQPEQVATLHTPLVPNVAIHQDTDASKLPQTASKLPLIGIFGLLALFSASYMRVRRIQ